MKLKPFHNALLNDIHSLPQVFKPNLYSKILPPLSKPLKQI